MKIDDHQMMYLSPVVGIAMLYYFVSSLRSGKVSRTLELPGFDRNEQPIGYYASMLFFATMFIVSVIGTLNAFT